MTRQVFYRRNLPHLHAYSGTYFITYRLHNSIPIHLLEELRAEYKSHLTITKDKNETLKHLFIKYDKLLENNQLDSINLTDPKLAEQVKRTLHYPDKKDYNLICYCIMPNHVHLVFELTKESKGVQRILHSIKRISAIEINKIISKTGALWQSESYDRLIRDDKELYHTCNYVLNNPVNAKLVSHANQWQHSYYDHTIISPPDPPADK
ncbi:MAG: transposase [Ignavibacteriaceae bacterium]|nr:transposase [Ignavibacteriaceae bacterium]